MDDLPEVESVESIIEGLKKAVPEVEISKHLDFGFTIVAFIPGTDKKVTLKKLLRPERDGVTGSWQIPTLAAAVEQLQRTR